MSREIVLMELFLDCKMRLTESPSGKHQSYQLVNTYLTPSFKIKLLSLLVEEI